MSNFDSKASTWDENPMHLERSKAVALKMQETITLNKEMKALEYGAGTGILSFLLSEVVGHITMMDNSVEMVKVMEQKVNDRKASNLLPVCLNLETVHTNARYNLIFNQMVLHHIVDVQAIFEKFYGMLLPDGYLAIADLYPEDGSFHGDGFDGHLGFDPENLKEMLLHIGFRKVNYEQCYQVERTNADGSRKSYPIFLLTASK
jgi:ubiquinone/menaquinone biosynthesis C-methylase UbiE